MADPFIGEIRIFAGNFAPQGWALCDGQLLQVSQNDALFSLFGTIYGGDGRSTFGLPDLRGRIPIHEGTGPGLPPYTIGTKAGTETETITVNTMPSHSHTWQATKLGPTESQPEANVIASGIAVGDPYAAGPNGSMADGASPAISRTGGSQSHLNVQPFQCLNYIVALFGIYPSRF